MEGRTKTPTGLENSCEFVISLCSLNINCLSVQKVVVLSRFNFKFIPPNATVCNNCDTSIQYVRYGFALLLH